MFHYRKIGEFRDPSTRSRRSDHQQQIGREAVVRNAETSRHGTFFNSARLIAMLSVARAKSLAGLSSARAILTHQHTPQMGARSNCHHPLTALQARSVLIKCWHLPGVVGFSFMSSIGSTSWSISVARSSAIISGERRHIKTGSPAQLTALPGPTLASVRSMTLVD